MNLQNHNLKEILASLRDVWAKSECGNAPQFENELQEFQYYFNTGVLHIRLHLDNMKDVAQSRPSEAATEYLKLENRVRKEVELCATVGRGLFDVIMFGSEH